MSGWNAIHTMCVRAGMEISVTGIFMTTAINILGKRSGDLIKNFECLN